MKITKLNIDGTMSGTGIRNVSEGGFIEPKDLGVSELLQLRISNWLERYELAYGNNFSDGDQIERLDKEGMTITSLLQAELPHIDIKYFSDGKMKIIPIS